MFYLSIFFQNVWFNSLFPKQNCQKSKSVVCNCNYLFTVTFLKSFGLTHFPKTKLSKNHKSLKKDQKCKPIIFSSWKWTIISLLHFQIWWLLVLKNHWTLIIFQKLFWTTLTKFTFSGKNLIFQISDWTRRWVLH